VPNWLSVLVKAKWGAVFEREGLRVTLGSIDRAIINQFLWPN